MNCPYCQRKIHAFTGLQELQKFKKHLAKCRKNPSNIVITDGKKTVVTPHIHISMKGALKIRAASGQ